MSRRSLGLSVGPEVIGAVLLERGVETWRATLTCLPDSDARRRALRQLLNGLPTRPWPRTPVTAAFEPAFVDFKPLEGLPLDSDADALQAALKANSKRFFLDRGSSWRLMPAQLRGDRWWAGIVDGEMLSVVESESASAGLRFRGVLPAAVLAMDETAGPLGTAAAAAGAELDWPVPFDPSGAARDARRRLGWRLFAGTALAVCLGLSVFTPELVLLTRGEPSARPEAMAREIEVARRQLAALHASSAAVDSVVRFAARRRSMLGLLGRLSGALPDSSAIVALRIDVRGASLVVLTPPGRPVLPVLSAIDGVATAQLIGAVTRETIQGRPVQRVAALLTFDRRYGGHDSAWRRP